MIKFMTKSFLYLKLKYLTHVYYRESKTHKFVEIDAIELLSNIAKYFFDPILTRLFYHIFVSKMKSFFQCMRAIVYFYACFLYV